MTKSLKFILIFFGFTSMLQAQKTDYALHWANKEINLFNSARIEPYAQDSFYCIWGNQFPNQNQSANLDSIALADQSGFAMSSIKMQTFNNNDLAICNFSNYKTNWALNLTATSLKSSLGKITLFNTTLIGDDLLLFCKITGDSLHIYQEHSRIQQIDLPEYAIWGLLKVSKDGNVSIINAWSAYSNDYRSRLIWANSNKYCIFLYRYSSWIASSSLSSFIPKDNALPDSLVNGCFIQYDFKTNQCINSLIGNFPIPSNSTSGQSHSMNSKILFAGTYLSKLTDPKFQTQKHFKLNAGNLNTFPVPNDFNTNRSYFSWMVLDMENWELDQFHNIQTSDTINPSFVGYGILKNGFWFLTSGMDSIKLDGANSQWSKLNLFNNNLFTYHSSEKKIYTVGFPQNVLHAYSDGDSLIFLYGDNSAANPNVSRVDMDGSPKFKYPLNKGKYTGEYFINGNLAWARNDDIQALTIYPTIFVSKSNQRYISPYFDKRADLDYGFKKLNRPYLGDYSGSIIRLSKAPISDFDIEHADFNHITVNYKGALNSQFYYKFGDGGTDSNLNQRWVLHSYQKTGKFLIQCIAANQFGNDTSFYQVEISEIVSTYKLKKYNPFKIYPNPTQGLISWKLDNMIGVDIYNSSGAHIQHIDSQESSINIEYLLPGIYFVSIKTREGYFIDKIIKE
ncbi:MAG: T9SS type A sorting domain-containing protein [Bacteroidia bacterium]|nr:T9SS type A sorting domain-containing protein [Bacteroidia bacterium]